MLLSWVGFSFVLFCVFRGGLCVVYACLLRAPKLWVHVSMHTDLQARADCGMYSAAAASALCLEAGSEPDSQHLGLGLLCPPPPVQSCAAVFTGAGCSRSACRESTLTH